MRITYRTHGIFFMKNMLATCNTNTNNKNNSNILRERTTDIHLSFFYRFWIYSSSSLRVMFNAELSWLSACLSLCLSVSCFSILFTVTFCCVQLHLFTWEQLCIYECMLERTSLSFFPLSSLFLTISPTLPSEMHAILLQIQHTYVCKCHQSINIGIDIGVSRHSSSVKSFFLSVRQSFNHYKSWVFSL